MIEITYILLAVIVLVVLIDLYLKRKNKLATTKEIEKVIDKENPDKKGFKKPIAIITVTLLLLTGLFFSVNHQLYDGKLTDTDDGISFIQNITLDKISYADMREVVSRKDDYRSQYLNKSTMQPISGIIVDSIPCNNCANGSWGRTDGVIINGLLQGEIRIWYKNGQLYSEGFYKNGEPVGIHTSWKKREFGKETTTYTDSIIIKKAWYPNGQYAGYETLDTGYAQHGQTYFTDQFGNLIYEGYYKHGVLDGLYRAFYKNGQLKSKVIYNQEKGNGVWEKWNEDGRLIEKGIVNEKNYQEIEMGMY